MNIVFSPAEAKAIRESCEEPGIKGGEMYSIFFMKCYVVFLQENSDFTPQFATSRKC
jgi:hypothetical protein